MKKTNWMRAVLVLPLLLAVSCNHLSHKRLAAYDAAMARRSNASADVIVLHSNAIPPKMPFSVPYATVHGDFHSGGDEWQAVTLRQHAIKMDLAPDFLIYVPQGAAYAGSVSTYVGFGIATSTPTYRPQAMAFCMREVGFATGLRINEQDMVTEVADESRACGIQEGDTVVSIAGSAVARPNNQLSPWEIEALQHQPGEKVRVVWIRPGSGRMEGEVVLQQPRDWAGIRSFTADYEERVKAAATAATNPVWSGR